jgi:eukaryotic-like serine/threonine-protein kinase
MNDTVMLSSGLPGHIKPGLVIAGKYRLEAEIGRGSMGTVFRAVHITLGQRVAIKLISGEQAQSLEARRRFSTEAKAAAKLRSRHVVQVIDDGETPEGNPYIVLEYLEGETLEQRLEREHDVPLADATRIVSHVGRALARAHAQGIVHRDLKPANIFLVRSDDEEVGWVAKVLDFGIAKLEQGEKGTTVDGTVLGTPLFMSPEQVRGASSVDHRADLYSLGMCLFHMLTGEYAHYSANYSDVLIAICTQPLPKLRDKAPWAPETVEQWFQRACAKEPLERFQSADEMTEALSATSGGHPLSRHQSAPEGRIAPETLVGYAAPPALGTQNLEATPLGLARTQALPRGPAPEPNAITAPIAIAVAVSPEPRVASTTGSEWQPPPKRDFRPLVIGLGLGLAALALLGALLRMSSKPSESSAPPPMTTAAMAPADAPPAVAIEPPAVVSPEPLGSSVAAQSAPSAPSRPLETARKPGRTAPPVTIPVPAAARPAAPSPAKSPNSDLGF